jgi:hypothetical protein
MDSSKENRRNIVNTVLYTYEVPTDDFMRISQNMTELPQFGPNAQVIQENFQVVNEPSNKDNRFSLIERLFSFIPFINRYDRGKVNENIEWNNDGNISKTITGESGNYTQNDYSDNYEELDDNFIPETQSSGFEIRKYLPL